MANQVFISYRRDDSAGYAGHVHDRLAREFGADLLFMDVDSIPLGLNFAKILREKVAKCSALIAVIGPNWIDARSEDGNRRLDNPDDFVRIEIAAALERGVPVIPILLNGAKIPRPDQLPDVLKELSLRNGLDVRHASFHSDMSRLIQGIKNQFSGIKKLPAAASYRQNPSVGQQRPAVLAGVFAAVALLIVIVSGSFYFWTYERQSGAVGLKEQQVGVPSAAAPTDADKATTGVSIGEMTAAVQRKDYPEAFRIASVLAPEGAKEAQFNLGAMYDRGLGTDQSDSQVATWYRKAAERGHVSAQFNLGVMYEAGRGVEKSDAQALDWYRKAADQGDAEAENTVGVFYALGQGVEQDDFAAVMWYEKAAKQSFAKAQKNLGDMYAQGRGVKQDDREALRWYYLAADQRHGAAAFKIGYWYETGRGGEKRDFEKAAAWYAKAIEYG